ncbi:hypothetical protein KI811_09840 [Geobacter hydrogenophilus]|uniref:Uncharacterized protein n=1 Tax=Geobacter hydrogenophilus TaxID=40983 RepID=A0A9W6LC94_9BACT|nr:hypothetical protein [Geobacter hydrogenophilus]MBT0894109.1 hypothetical protein [Geobacter hydrogenophilus]GLI38608.1 hypothetical protein GHYDROH2_21090 [Geobacter hydrogenophilus]
MKIPFAVLCLFAVSISVLPMHASAAERGVVNLVKPLQPQPPIDAVENEVDDMVCEQGFVMQEDGRCCAEGTDNGMWADVCTPTGTVEGQVFNYNEIPHYCPSSDMFIVSDRNLNWFSCADSDSTAMYTAAKGFEGCQFCRDHGYGCLIRIKPWGTVGCIQVGDSQGDGCIEAGTCAFGK